MINMGQNMSISGLAKLLGSGLLLLTLNVSAGQTAAPQDLYPGQQPPIALINATVVVAPGQRLQDATVVLKDGYIANVAAGRHIPDGAQVVDLTGRWIYPGFVDPYSDFGLAAVSYQHTDIAPPVYQGTQAGAGATNDAIHAAMDWSRHVAAERDDQAAQAYWQNGFTTVQSAQLDGIFQGRSVALSVGPGTAQDVVYQARNRQFMSLDKGSSQQLYPTSLMGTLALIRQTLSDAQWYRQAQGKRTQNGPVEQNADLAALADIAQQGVVITGSDEHMLLRLTRLFKPFDIPLAVLGNAYEYARIDAVKASGATVLLPLALPAPPPVDDAALVQQVSLAELRHWERAPKNAAVLAQEGIPFAFTMYGAEPEHAWQTLRTFVRNGLPPEQALAALTTVPAQLAGLAEQSGKIASGYRADLVIADADLFESGKIVAVYTRGQRQSVIDQALLALAGHYQLSWQGKPVDLQIDALAGDEQPQIRVSYNGERLDIGPVHRLLDVVSFKIDLTPWLADGQGRLTLTHHGETLQASLWLPDGREPSLQVTVLAPTAAVPLDNPPLVGQLTYPNTGYGLAQQPPLESLLIRNVTLWTSEQQGVIEHADVQIANGKIEAIGQQLEVPSGYHQLDGSNKYLTAGIIDEHSHIAITGGVNEASDAITSEVRVGDVINPDDISIYRALAGGVTAAQLLHGSANPIGGQAQMIKMRWGKDAEGLKFKAAPATIKFALGENVKQSNRAAYTKRYPQTRSGVTALMDNAFTAAANYQQEQQDYEQLSRSRRKAIAPPRTDYRLQALAEILEHKRFIHIHSYVASEILSMMRVADRHDFQVQTFTHVLEGYKVAKEMAEHHATASTFSDWWAYKFEVYDAIPQNTCLMHDAGIITSVNSDSNDIQRRLNQEAAKSMYYCGMTEQQAWNMVTINPAKQMKIEQYVGSVKEGKQADLVLWDHNPLSVRARVVATWVDGRRYYDQLRDRENSVRLQQEKQSLIRKVLSTPVQGGWLPQAYKQEASDWRCYENQDQQEQLQ